LEKKTMSADVDAIAFVRHSARDAAHVFAALKDDGFDVSPFQ